MRFDQRQAFRTMLVAGTVDHSVRKNAVHFRWSFIQLSRNMDFSTVNIEKKTLKKYKITIAGDKNRDDYTDSGQALNVLNVPLFRLLLSLAVTCLYTVKFAHNRVDGNIDT